MIRCSSCGVENLDAARFCMNCTAPLTAAPPLAEERKVVTTLICDLVAFTAMSEAADPEDIDALLGSYHTAARKAIESHGGTVEKFIGDAVVGVFGVPAAHEDDPERAVRAALRLVQALDGLAAPDGTPLSVRIGVNTGEALVRLDVDPLSGRGFLTGDAVNVAARLQAAAPPGGVVMGQSTFALAGRAFSCEELAPVEAKGKSEPLVLWLAKAPLARLGSVAEQGRLTPLVDREVELAYLKALFDKALAAAAPQFALIVGEPGIGKSRLLVELSAYVDASSAMVTWRQGRCLPYGEGVTFWALAEIVKAHAGILDSDTAALVDEKLGRVLPSGADREWFRQRLRALLGLEAPQASREENFAAWPGFLEHLALSQPLVVVFEDLHWADEGLLAFIEHLATHVDRVPLVMLGTARPELFEGHPTFAAGSTQLNRISLEPLTPAETERLVNSLVGEAEALSQRAADIVAHCEGNPFFAEESARLLNDRVQGTALPASIQAVVAARLDALPAEQKAVLGDAAVVGDVFWNGAVAALGQGEATEVDGALRALVAKHLVRRVRQSSMAGENEFVFGHALAREVAYGELPRAVRARKHAAAAVWFEAKAGARAEDLAEVVAHHYATALELARTLGDEELAASLEAPTIRQLAHAGERGLRLDATAAERYFARALELTGPDSNERPRLLFRWGWAVNMHRAGHREMAAAVEEAIPGLQACGDIRTAAAAMTWLAIDHLRFGEPSAELQRAAVDLLANDEPSAEQAWALAGYAANLYDAEADYQATIAAATRAIAICEQLGLPEPAVAMSYRGLARLDLGDLGGLEDQERALAGARAQGLGLERAMIESYYVYPVMLTRRPPATLDAIDEGLEFTRRCGIGIMELSLRTQLVESLRRVGEWDRALAEAGGLAPSLEEVEDAYNLVYLRTQQVLILACRGEPTQAAPLLAWLAQQGRTSEAIQFRGGALLAASALHLRLGESDAALALLKECVPWMSAIASADEELFPEALRLALACDDAPLAAQIVASIESFAARESLPLHRHVLATVGALLAASRGEHEAALAGLATAAAGWCEFGMPYEEAQALLGQGRCLVALGRAPEATVPLAAAREIFTRLGAKPALAETDELIQQMASA